MGRLSSQSAISCSVHARTWALNMRRTETPLYVEVEKLRPTGDDATGLEILKTDEGGKHKFLATNMRPRKRITSCEGGREKSGALVIGGPSLLSAHWQYLQRGRIPNRRAANPSSP